MNSQIEINIGNNRTEESFPPAKPRSWLERASWLANALAIFPASYAGYASWMLLHPLQHPLPATTTPMDMGNPMASLKSIVVCLVLAVTSTVTNFFIAFQKKQDAAKSVEELNARLRQVNEQLRLAEQETERYRSEVGKLRNEIGDLRRTQMRDEVDRLKNETRNESERLRDEIARLRNSMAPISQPQLTDIVKALLDLMERIESCTPRPRPPKVNRPRIKQTGTHG